MTTTNTLLDRAREAAQHAVASAQDALASAQDKLAEMSRESRQRDLLAGLGSAFYAEQRTGGDRAAVDAALSAVDDHVAAYGWQQAQTPGPASDASDAADSAQDAASDDAVDLTEPGAGQFNAKGG
ncbi:MAG TPA: hypothetical protein VES02_10410 [Dermatophilaceae bacterium]|nr:hypothetical protein [Dermatophilaceae bacterium]